MPSVESHQSVEPSPISPHKLVEFLNCFEKSSEAGKMSGPPLPNKMIANFAEKRSNLSEKSIQVCDGSDSRCGGEEVSKMAPSFICLIASISTLGRLQICGNFLPQNVR